MHIYMPKNCSAGTVGQNGGHLICIVQELFTGLRAYGGSLGGLRCHEMGYEITNETKIGFKDFGNMAVQLVKAQNWR
jgi:hypothetical protein